MFLKNVIKKSRAFTPLEKTHADPTQVVRVRKHSSLTGFTLIEIMVVVSILLILIGLAIPAILRSRSVANEGAAMANLKTASNACQLFQANSGAFPTALTDLIAPISNPPYLDSTLVSGHKQGYAFVYSRNVDGLGFTIRANPESLLAGRYYYVDQTGTMRVNPDEEAGPGDEEVK